MDARYEGTPSVEEFTKQDGICVALIVYFGGRILRSSIFSNLISMLQQ